MVSFVSNSAPAPTPDELQMLEPSVHRLVYQALTESGEGLVSDITSDVYIAPAKDSLMRHRTSSPRLTLFSINFLH